MRSVGVELEVAVEQVVIGVVIELAAAGPGLNAEGADGRLVRAELG